MSRYRSNHHKLRLSNDEYASVQHINEHKSVVNHHKLYQLGNSGVVDISIVKLYEKDGGSKFKQLELINKRLGHGPECHRIHTDHDRSRPTRRHFETGADARTRDSVVQRILRRWIAI